MLPKEVLEDICWSLTRRDLEALLLTHHVWSGVVTDSFTCTGPLRAISHATLNDDGLKCQSDDEEKVIENPKDYGLCLRNTVVSQLSFDCDKELSAEAIESLKAVKGKCLLENLRLRGTATGPGLTVLKNDVFSCEKLSYEFHYYSYDDESEEEGNEGDESDGDEDSEDVSKSDSSPEEFTAAFFNSNTVKQANCLALIDTPPCDVELIVEWLHYGNGKPMSMNIWWECNGEDELDSLKLIKILKEKFMEATSPQQYEFYAGAERFDSSEIRNAYLENLCGEFLEIESISTCYSHVRITRLPMEATQRLRIVPTLEGPKVWDFHTIDELDAYLTRNSLMDLLARSGLIANQVQCKCGHRMHLRQMSLFQPEVSRADRLQWHCSGWCRRFTTTMCAGSWYKAKFNRWYWTDLDFYVKLVILVASRADTQETVRALYVKDSFVEGNGGLATFKEKYNGIWGDDTSPHEGECVGDVIKLFYEKVREKYPLDGTYQLPANYSQW